MNRTILVIPLLVVSFFFLMGSHNQATALSSFYGEFDGKFDNKMINADGKFRIGSDIGTFVLVGTFENSMFRHWDPLSGVYITSNPNCQNIIGDLTLQGEKRSIDLDFTAKSCKYGLISYVIGTFETEGGEGRITFVADHHENNVSGQLKGVIEVSPEPIMDDVDVSDTVELSTEEDVPQDHKVVINDGMSATGDAQ